MDLSGVQDLIPDIARFFNINPATALLFVTILVSMANVAGRMIPDDKTGVLGFIRNASKFIGLVVANRVTSGVTTNDAAKVIVAQTETWAKDKIDSLPGISLDVPANIAVGMALDEAGKELARVTPAFPNFKRSEDGEFAAADQLRKLDDER